MYPCMAAQCKSAAECASDLGTASESYSNFVRVYHLLADWERLDCAILHAHASFMFFGVPALASIPAATVNPGSKQERSSVASCRTPRMPEESRTLVLLGTIRWSVPRAPIIAVRVPRPACDMLGEPHPRLR